MKKMLMVIFVVILIFAAAVLFFNANTNTTNQTVSPTSSLTSPIVDENDTSPSPGDTENWQTYTSEEIGFSIMHPMEVEAQDTQEGVLLSQWGPTQQEGTEFYDGISLQFSTGSLDGMFLQEYVTQQQNQSANDPIVTEVSEVRPVTIGSYSGYAFDVNSIGERTYTYLPNGESEYLLIINGTVDPTNAGFSSTVNRMLSTLEIQ